MPITPVLLEVDGYNVSAVRFDANPKYNDEQRSTGGIDVDFDVYPHVENPLLFHVAMTIDIAADEVCNEPYGLYLHLNGYFSFKPEAPEETIRKMLFSNAVPILYGIARGYVGQLTGTAPHGPLMLPSVNFVELADRKREAQESGSAPVLPEGDDDARQTGEPDQNE